MQRSWLILLATLGALMRALPAVAISPAEAEQRKLGFAAKGEEAPPSTMNVEIECGGGGSSRKGLADGEFMAGKPYVLSEPNSDGLSSVVYLGLPQFAIKIPRTGAWASLPDEASSAPPASDNAFASKYIPKTFECQLTCAQTDAGCAQKLGPEPVPILVKDKVDGYTLTDIILTLSVDGKPGPGDAVQCNGIGSIDDFTEEKYDSIKALQGGEGTARGLTRIFRSLTGTDRRSQMQPKIEAMLKCMLGEAGEAAHVDDGIFYQDIKPDNVMFGKWGGGEDRLAVIDYSPEKSTGSFEDEYLPKFDMTWRNFNCPTEPCPCKYWGEVVQGELTEETLQQWSALCTNDAQFASSGTSHLRLNAGDPVRTTLDQINRVLTKELDILDHESRA